MQLCEDQDGPLYGNPLILGVSTVGAKDKKKKKKKQANAILQTHKDTLSLLKSVTNTVKNT